MRLTPDDVRAKEFRVALRGYAVEEVDAFLDTVETELRRLLDDRVASGPAVPAAPPPGADTGSDEPVTERAVRTLVLAEQTADRLVTEARTEAEHVAADARDAAARVRAQAEAEAGGLVAQAREQADGLLSQARADADETIGTARAEADDIVRRAHVAALSVERELVEQTQRDVAALQERRGRLEGAVQELVAAERACRERLRRLLDEHGEVHERLRTVVGTPEAPTALHPAA